VEILKREIMPNPGLFVSVSGSPSASKPACSRIGQRGFADGIEARAAGQGWPVCGFSLVELVVIIVVMAILAVIAVPRMLDFNTFSEVGFHDAIKASVQYARKLAVGSRRYVCVNVTPGTGSAGKVAILQDTTAPESVGTVSCGAAVGLPAASTVTGCLVNEVCGPNGVTLGGASFIFDPLGRPVAADKTPLIVALAPLTVASATGSQPNITIQLNTGLVD
jgi:MSHA pilin protein MshC